MNELEILKDIEDKVSGLERIYNDVIETSNSLILRWSERGIGFINRRGREFFGYTVEEIIGKPFTIILPPRDSSGKSLKQLAEDILQNPHNHVNVQNEVVKKNGEPAWVAWSNKAIKREDGGLEIITIGNDITDRVRFEQQLRRREAEFKDLVQNSTDIIARWDEDLRYLYINPRITDITGMRPEEYIGRSIFGLHLKDEQALAGVITAAIKSGTVQRVELELVTSRGIRVLDQTIIPESGEDDRKRTVMGVARDITELKTAQQVLERDKQTLERLVEERTNRLLNAQRQLEQARRLSDLGQLAAIVAHELRNPLASIQMASFNIKRKAGSERIQGNLDTIDRKINESNQIINDILFYSRIKTPRYEQVPIAEILNECLEFVRQKSVSCNAQVVGELDPVKTVRVEADPVQLKEVFTNILNNSCDAVKDIHGRQGKITVSAEARQDKLAVSIVDNGVGMDRETLNNLGKPFYTNKSQGTGLGLTASRQILNLHNGSLDIRSEKDKYTDVTVILPYRHQ